MNYIASTHKYHIASSNIILNKIIIKMITRDIAHIDYAIMEG